MRTANAILTAMTTKYKGFGAIVTSRCNLRCSFCLRGKRSDDSIALPLFDSVCRQANALGYNHVALTGGEACMHPEFSGLLDVIAGHDMRFAMVSNGLAVEQKDVILKHADRLSNMTFSLESHTQETHDLLRGKGSYRKAVHAVRTFKASGARVYIQTMLNKHNWRDLESYVDFGFSLGVDSIRISGVLPRPWTGDIELSVEERQEVSKLIEAIWKRSTEQCRIHGLSSSHVALRECTIWKSHDFVVTADGDMLFCCDLDGDVNVIGSLRSTSLKKLLKRRIGMARFLMKHYQSVSCVEPGKVPCEICEECLRGYCCQPFAYQVLMRAAAAGLVCVNLLQSGCATVDIMPKVSAGTDDAGNVQAQVGIQVGETSENPEYHGGFWREAGQTVFGPFHVYRSGDKKWFPEWREHPYRTTGMTLLYVGAAAAASSGGGGGSKNDSGTTSNTSNTSSGDGGDDDDDGTSPRPPAPTSNTSNTSNTSSGSTSDSSSGSGSSSSGSSSSGSTSGSQG
jgi:MoaA/NifB/PqqE/SkfB family radical SAM enzyme